MASSIVGPTAFGGTPMNVVTVGPTAFGGTPTGGAGTVTEIVK
jgi:hypothetical protein